MKVTYELVGKMFKEADQMMKRIFPNTYKSPIFVKIRITNAHYYWMQIGKLLLENNRWTLKISREFENYTDDERASKRMLESMIHELIHTLPDCMNHGYDFLYAANLFMKRYPEYEITVKSGGGEGYVAPRKEIHYKYIITCPKCGKTYKYQRKTDAVRYPFLYHCTCGCNSLEVAEVK